MKILYSLPHPADRLGSQQAGHVIRAAALTTALQALGHDVIRIEAAAGQSQAAQSSIGFYRSVMKRFLPRPLAMMMRDAARIRFGKIYARRLISAAQEYKPDLILETHIAFSLAGKIASQFINVPLVLDDCAPAWEEEQQYGVGLRQAARDIHREVTMHAGLLVAVNQTLRQYLLAEGAPADKVITVENGIDVNLFNPQVDGNLRREQFGIQQNTVLIVFVGSFQPYHRVDLLLRAFQIMDVEPKPQLLLVGEGQTYQASKSLADELGISRYVTFAGRVAYEEVPSYVAAGDITIMPATNEYGNPMKLYEYMALGKVVTAPNQPTITEIATHGVDSYLFERENIQSMAEALKKLARDHDLRTKLGAKGAQRAFEHTWMRRGQVLAAAMQTLLRRN